MNIKETKRFIKNKQKLILLGILMLGIFWVGSPHIFQTGLELYGVRPSGNITAINGEYVDLSWSAGDGEPFGNSWWGYQIIRVDTVSEELEHVLTAPIVFAEQEPMTNISYTELIQGYEDGDIIQIGLELWEDATGVLTNKYYITITIEGMGTTETTTTTTTGETATSAVEDDLFSGMGIITAMAVGGGIIFAMAVMATAWRKRR